jgi:phosphoglycerate dehydrogenase-like enzyme
VSMSGRDAYRVHVVLIDFSRPLFEPVGFESERMAAAGASWEQFECRIEDQVLEVARDAVVVVVQSVRPLLTRRVIEQLPAARCLIRAGAGYDSIDVAAATEQGIMVCNTPAYCSIVCATCRDSTALCTSRFSLPGKRARRGGCAGPHWGSSVSGTLGGASRSAYPAGE